MGLAAAASIAGIVAAWNFAGSPRSRRSNIKAQLLQYNDEPLASARWSAACPKATRSAAHVHRLPRTTWRPVYGFLNRSDLNGVAYDLILRGTTATLYVVPARVSHLPAAPPERLGIVSGGRAVASWQENGLLYVLVVHGNEQAYQSFIKRPMTL